MEAELIRKNGAIPTFIWSGYFIEVQGFEVKKEVFMYK